MSKEFYKKLIVNSSFAGSTLAFIFIFCYVFLELIYGLQFENFQNRLTDLQMIGQLIPYAQAVQLKDIGGGEGKVENPAYFWTPGTSFGSGGNVTVGKVALNAINFLLALFAVAGVGSLIFSGAMYITSGGDQNRKEKAKKMLTYSVMGIVLVVAGLAVLTVLKAILFSTIV